MLPDSSAGLWLLVAPNLTTVQWDAGTPLVSLGVDPILALQWATAARGIIATPADNESQTTLRLTPPLKDTRGPEYLLLARNPRKAAPKDAFVFLVSDSASHTQWKAFVASAQVDTFLTAIEEAATHRQVNWAGDSVGIARANDSVDVPVQVIAQPRPEYPGRLASVGREGRVWISYVVDSTGRAEPGSFHTLLSDDELFTRSAITALLHSKYRPARLHGHSIRQRVFQVVAFRQR